MLYCPNFFWNVLQVWMTGNDVYLQMTWSWPDKTWNILCSYYLQWNTSQSKFRNHYFLFFICVFHTVPTFSDLGLYKINLKYVFFHHYYVPSNNVWGKSEDKTLLSIQWDNCWRSRDWLAIREHKQTYCLLSEYEQSETFGENTESGAYS